jgi:RNA polymerase sigma factor (sigma-70 family)
VTLEQIIKGCKGSHTKAQEQLYQLFSKQLFAVCLKYSSSYEDAQDNLQDGFILIFRKIEQFTGKGSFEGWAKRVIINNALQKLKGVRYIEIQDEHISEIEVEIDDEKIPLDYLLKIIHELSDQYRIVFSLYVLDGYSHQEISEMLNISTGTTKSNLFRARLILKEKIEQLTEVKFKSSAK